MSASRGKIKGRSGGTFFAIPHAVMRSENWRMMPPRAVKLVCDLGGQFNGNNNGDLSAAWGVMQPLGWRSRTTIDSAEIDAIRFGMIQRTRQGGRHSCNLYALTWLPIHECGGKLEVPPTNVASGLWKLPPQYEQTFEKQKIGCPKSGHQNADRPKIWASKRKVA
jgi:hypothetical protein